jgi:hypothetical protein
MNIMTCPKRLEKLLKRVGQSDDGREDKDIFI